MQNTLQFVLADYGGGISVGGRIINNLRYAADITLLAGSASELKNLIERVRVQIKEFGLFLNVNKTTVMKVNNRKRTHLFMQENKQLSGIHDIKPG